LRPVNIHLMDEPQPRPEFGAGDWNLVKDLFFEYQNDSPEDLDSWLASRCPTAEVRAEVERLIRAGKDSADFLERNAAEQYLGAARPHPVKIGRYRIIQELGAGGLGIVYAAWDEQLQRRVAVKVLHSRAVGDPQLRKRLLWDAKAAGGLQHPNIVVIYEIGTDGGQDYVAMECVTGRTLGQLLEVQPGGLDARRVLDYAIQIARGLEAAHNAGIVHRDLKPGNIMITDDGVVKLLDFGLAKNEGGFLGGADAPTTIEGRFAGTVAYVSPEQAEGRTVDARSDIFSFGCVLFEMLTGRQAFRGGTALSVLASILQGEPPQIQSIRPVVDYHFEEIVQGCLRKNPAERFQTMRTVRSRLEELVRDETVELPRARPKQKTGRIKYVLAAAGLVCGLVAGLAMGWRLKPAAATSWLEISSRLRITFDSGLSGYPAISRDGKMIAYASDRAGNGSLNLFMQYGDSAELRQLTFGSYDDYEPVFSSDGTRIVYRSEQQPPGLYDLNWNSLRNHLLARDGRGAQFSPDGKRLAYWTGDTGASLYPLSAQMFVVGSLGGAPQRIFTDFDAAAYPVWSPAGDRVVFLGRKGDQSTIDWWVGSIADGTSHPTGILALIKQFFLVKPPGKFYAVPSAWLKRGNTVLFTASRGDSTNIWALNVDAMGRPIGVPHLWTAGTGVENQPSVAELDDATTLVYAATNVSTSVWRVPLDSHGVAKSLGESVTTESAESSAPSITTDGHQLLYGSRQQGVYSINLLDLFTGKQRTLFKLQTLRPVRPVISGNGEYIAFTDAPKGVVMAVRDGVPEQICERCGPPTHLSFDGRRVIFESADVPEQLVVSVNRQAPRPLLSGVAGASEVSQFGGRFSPDQRWVAFHGRRRNSSKYQIFVAPVPDENRQTGAAVTALTDGAYDREPYWSPDGKRIYFLSKADGFECVWALNIDARSAAPEGRPFEVAQFHHARKVIRGPGGYSGDIGLSVAANYMVMTVAETTGNVWLQPIPQR